MSIIRHIQRLKFIDYLIQKKATGNLVTFAKKNGLSKRGLTNIIEEMKEIGFPIKYSRKLNSYFYEEEGEMVKCLFIQKGEILTRDETKQLLDGNPDNLCFSKVKIFEVCETK